MRTIFRSSPSVRIFEYRISSLIISSKVVRFFPETCQRPVSPGIAWKRSHCHGWYLLNS